MIDDPLNRLKVKRGSELPWAKLDETRVAEILCLVAKRAVLLDKARALTNARLAKRFGVSVRTIDRITGGESWTHVEAEE